MLRKKGTACLRCRTSKIRCDDAQPLCSNCAKSGHECIRSRGSNAEVESYIQQLEARVRSLEGQLTDVSNAAAANEQLFAHRPGLDAGASPYRTSPRDGVAASSPSSSQIGPNEPLAHNVGLISLASSKDPKYLGPSSGVTLGRLAFAAMPPSQGLSVALLDETRHSRRHITNASGTSLSGVPKEDLMYFVETYFDVYQSLYPFLDEAEFPRKLEEIETSNISLGAGLDQQRGLSSLDLIQVLLVLALGSKTLEARLSTDFSAESYYATAIRQIGDIHVFESIQGVQILLLLTLASLAFENGLNAWFLSHTIIASCLDLGLQRKHSSTSESLRAVSTNVRSGIFWSAYSIDRTLCVVLGRPLTLRDEAIDIELPGKSYSEFHEAEHATPSQHNDSPQSQSNATSIYPPRKRVQLTRDPYAAACYSVRFDQITAEIKLMLHRVAQSPERFPWPRDIPSWQVEVNRALEQLLQDLTAELKWRSARRGTNRTLRELELKYHQCIMLLHRPSPAVQQPSMESFQACYKSAVETLSIYSYLNRFSDMPNTWLAAHSVFVSGITMMYCVWTCPPVRQATTLEEFSKNADSCIKVLKFLSRTWTVAEDAMVKFEKLATMTKLSWQDLGSASRHEPTGQEGTIVVAQGQGHTMSDGQHPSGGLAHLQNYPDQVNHASLDGMTMAPGHMMSSGTFGAENEFPDFFLGELGPMSDWFDLGWMGDFDTSAPPPGMYDIVVPNTEEMNQTTGPV